MNFQGDMIETGSGEKAGNVQYADRNLLGQACRVAIVRIPEGEGIFWDAIDVCRAFQISDPPSALEELKENVDKVLFMDEDYNGRWFIHESCFNKLQPEYQKTVTTPERT